MERAAKVVEVHPDGHRPRVVRRTGADGDAQLVIRVLLQPPPLLDTAETGPLVVVAQVQKEVAIRRPELAAVIATVPADGANHLPGWDGGGVVRELHPRDSERRAPAAVRRVLGLPGIAVKQRVILEAPVVQKVPAHWPEAPLVEPVQGERRADEQDDRDGEPHVCAPPWTCVEL